MSNQGGKGSTPDADDDPPIAGDARRDPATPVSQCLENWKDELGVFTERFTVEHLQSYTYDDFVALLGKKGVATELCLPIADDIIVIWGDAVFKKGGPSGAPPSATRGASGAQPSEEKGFITPQSNKRRRMDGKSNKDSAGQFVDHTPQLGTSRRRDDSVSNQPALAPDEVSAFEDGFRTPYETLLEQLRPLVEEVKTLLESERLPETINKSVVITNETATRCGIIDCELWASISVMSTMEPYKDASFGVLMEPSLPASDRSTGGRLDYVLGTRKLGGLDQLGRVYLEAKMNGEVHTRMDSPKNLQWLAQLAAGIASLICDEEQQCCNVGAVYDGNCMLFGYLKKAAGSLHVDKVITDKDEALLHILLLLHFSVNPGARITVKQRDVGGRAKGGAKDRSSKGGGKSKGGGPKDKNRKGGGQSKSSRGTAGNKRGSSTTGGKSYKSRDKSSGGLRERAKNHDVRECSNGHSKRGNAHRNGLIDRTNKQPTVPASPNLFTHNILHRYAMIAHPPAPRRIEDIDMLY
eukprot:m.145100 g.145100  ORF g.145100 m.145100 type:complete len:524 (-) comp11615_c0_seq4:179-1750(-)